MTALDETRPRGPALPSLLRHAARHLPSGQNREALLRYADEFESEAGSTVEPESTARGARDGGGVESRPPERDFDEPPHISRPPKLRRDAQRHPPGPNRDALLRYADELEEKRDDTLVASAIAAAALKALGTEYDDEGNPIETPALEPLHITLPPRLRRKAQRHPPGPNRDALLRYADELEEKRDDTLVERAISRDALTAYATDCNDPPE